ncbi:MAG TPA: thioredoxin family protein [Chthoniobacterales bacterium]|nr:thioredoxin family protein [Chthoniobacterales bacterium]
MRFLLPAVVAAAALAVSCSKEETPPVKTADVSTSAKPGWLTSYEKAQKEAQAGNKLLLMDFTGSDWCGWCIMLDREIFSKPEFKEYAQKNLVLLELDFPKTKKMPTETVEQNRRLAFQYQIMSFPTVVVLNGAGKVVGALGYMKGGPSVFIAQLEKMRNG